MIVTGVRPPISPIEGWTLIPKGGGSTTTMAPDRTAVSVLRFTAMFSGPSGVDAPIVSGSTTVVLPPDEVVLDGDPTDILAFETEKVAAEPMSIPTSVTFAEVPRANRGAK